MDTEIEEALLRLLEVAYRDTGQSRRVASFLLAWWNADTCGGFDLTNLWGLDQSLREDIVRVFAFVAFDQHYPDTLGWRQEFGVVLRRWRPHLLDAVPDTCGKSDLLGDEAVPSGGDHVPELELQTRINSAHVDPDVFMAEMRAAAEDGDSDAAEFLALFVRWEGKFGAKLLSP